MSIALRKGILSALISVPALVLFYLAVSDQLGPDPADKLVAETGEWALRLLCVTLAITPLQSFFSTRQRLRRLRPLRYRRILGVVGWVYAALHLLCYCAFLLAWQWADIGAELVERPYITVGFIAFVLMTPLAITSTDAMVRRLGRRWKSLHRSVYAVAVLAAAHIIWQIRSDAGEAIFYSGLIAALLIWRLIDSRKSA